jgi:hypothetical protein
MKALRIIFAVIALTGIGLIVAAVVLISNRYSGTKVIATVTGCATVSAGKTASSECSGTWVIGGPLVGGNGHVVLGTIDGAEPSDIGKKITVYATGDHAHTTSIRVPIILIVIGLFLLVTGALVMVNPGAGKGRTRSPADT